MINGQEDANPLIIQAVCLKVLFPLDGLFAM